MAVAATNVHNAGDPGPIKIVFSHWPMRVRFAERLGDDELLDFCAANPDLRIECAADGELIIMPPAGAETSGRNFDLVVEFGAWVRRDGTGKGFESSAGFRLPNGAMRSPDMAWVRKQRWDALTESQRKKFSPLCPDFVVELRSPSDTLAELRAKLVEYIANGAQLGWLIDPEGKRVYVYRPGREVEELIQPESLRGDPELPGLVLDLRSIW